MNELLPPTTVFFEVLLVVLLRTVKFGQCCNRRVEFVTRLAEELGANLVATTTTTQATTR